MASSNFKTRYPKPNLAPKVSCQSQMHLPSPDRSLLPGVPSRDRRGESVSSRRVTSWQGPLHIFDPFASALRSCVVPQQGSRQVNACLPSSDGLKAWLMLAAAVHVPGLLVWYESHEGQAARKVVHVFLFLAGLSCSSWFAFGRGRKPAMGAGAASDPEFEFDSLNDTLISTWPRHRFKCKSCNAVFSKQKLGDHRSHCNARKCENVAECCMSAFTLRQALAELQWFSSPYLLLPLVPPKAARTGLSHKIEGSSILAAVFSRFQFILFEYRVGGIPPSSIWQSCLASS